MFVASATAGGCAVGGRESRLQNSCLARLPYLATVNLVNFQRRTSQTPRKMLSFPAPWLPTCICISLFSNVFIIYSKSWLAVKQKCWGFFCSPSADPSQSCLTAFVSKCKHCYIMQGLTTGGKSASPIISATPFVAVKTYALKPTDKAIRMCDKLIAIRCSLMSRSRTLLDCSSGNSSCSCWSVSHIVECTTCQLTTLDCAAF